MGVKLGLSHKGKSIDWGCLRTGFWGEYLDLRGMWSMKISCTMRSLIMCTHPQILLRRSNQGGWDGRGMWHAWDRREKCTRFWWESPKGRDHSEDRVVDGRMGSELILGRLAVCVWRGFSCLSIWTGGGLLWTRWWAFGFWRHGASWLVSWLLAWWAGTTVIL
jgi:hypothetical protein